MQKGKLSIHSENIFPIIKKWLYSDMDIFVRELVSNATDAITKLEKLRILGEAQKNDEEYCIQIEIDKEQRTISFTDNGIGMTEEEIDKYINQIAFSGAAEFLEKYSKKESDDAIIGHFGLGFYSCFMVSESVTIDTLSYQEGAKAVQWSCAGDTDYTTQDSDRKKTGTTITLHINEEGKKFLEIYELNNVVRNYCSYMPYKIVVKEKGSTLEEKPVNEKEPLWIKNPKDCTDEEYKEFYHANFMDLKDPLFWIHLNMDFPVKLQGILYFPNFSHEYELNEGEVKLFSNRVYVADNIKEVIPEFLLLLKGMIDCPELPLNVSRSFLQTDEYVTKISKYIVKKVSDKLVSLHNTNLTEYQTIWESLGSFIKYSCLRDENFYEKVKDILLAKTIQGEWTPIVDYANTLESAEYQKTIYYATNPEKESTYIKLFKESGQNALILNSNFDTHFIAFLEMKMPNLKFARIDSNINVVVKKEGIDEDTLKKFSTTLKEIFTKFVPTIKDLDVRAENFNSTDVTGMLLISENGRRMQEMFKMYGKTNPFMNAPIEKTLALNTNNDLVKYILDNKDKLEENKLNMLCNQIYDIARLTNEGLSEEDMDSFIKRNNTLLSIMIK